MKKSQLISHDGEVIEKKGDCYRVRIISHSACSECHIKGSCSASEMSEKIIDAHSDQPLTPGDKVVLKMAEKYGWMAVFIAFLLPFMIMILVLFTIFIISNSELSSSIYAVGSLVIYYFSLYLLRDRLGKDIVFRAERKI